jgi:hypothetical protein
LIYINVFLTLYLSFHNLKLFYLLFYIVQYNFFNYAFMYQENIYAIILI